MSELKNFDDKAVKTFSVECPQCHELTEVMLGENTCQHCGAPVTLEIER